MKKMQNWDKFYNYITESEGESQEEKPIRTYPGDNKWEYQSDEDDWWARKKQGNGDWYQLTGDGYNAKYQSTIDKLDIEYSDDRTDNAPNRVKKKNGSTQAQNSTNTETLEGTSPHPGNKSFKLKKPVSIGGVDYTNTGDIERDYSINFGPITQDADGNLSFPNMAFSNSNTIGVIDSKKDLEDFINSSSETASETASETSTNTETKATQVNTQAQGQGNSSTAVKPAQSANDTKNNELINKGQQIFANFIREKTLRFRNLTKNVIVYIGKDLQEDDREALVAYIQTMNFRLSRDNFDHRKGEKLVFKRNPDTKPSEKEKQIPVEPEKKPVKPSNFFEEGDDAATINKKILNLFKKDKINFTNRNDYVEREKGRDVRKLDIILKCEPLSKVDSEILTKYLAACSYKPVTDIDNATAQQSKMGDQITYKFTPEKDLVDIQQNNIVSVFLHFYLNGQLRNRNAIARLFSKRDMKFKGAKNLDSQTREDLEEFVQSMKQKSDIKFNESRILNWSEFVNYN